MNLHYMVIIVPAWIHTKYELNARKWKDFLQEIQDLTKLFASYY